MASQMQFGPDTENPAIPLTDEKNCNAVVFNKLEGQRQCRRSRHLDHCFCTTHLLPESRKLGIVRWRAPKPYPGQDDLPPLGHTGSDHPGFVKQEFEMPLSGPQPDPTHVDSGPRLRHTGRRARGIDDMDISSATSSRKSSLPPNPRGSPPQEAKKGQYLSRQEFHAGVQAIENDMEAVRIRILDLFNNYRPGSPQRPEVRRQMESMLQKKEQRHTEVSSKCKEYAGLQQDKQRNIQAAKANFAKQHEVFKEAYENLLLQEGDYQKFLTEKYHDQQSEVALAEDVHDFSAFLEKLSIH